MLLDVINHGIRGGLRFISKWPRSYFKDLENSRNFLVSRAVPVGAWYRLLFRYHNYRQHCTFVTK